MMDIGSNFQFSRVLNIFPDKEPMPVNYLNNIGPRI